MCNRPHTYKRRFNDLKFLYVMHRQKRIAPGVRVKNDGTSKKQKKPKKMIGL